MLTTITGAASAGSALNYSKQTTSMLKIAVQDPDCEHFGDVSDIIERATMLKHSLSEHQQESRTSNQCCQSVSVLTFPATMYSLLKLVQASTLAPIGGERKVKPRPVTKSIYKPPIA
jgi:hypothetical protein